MSGPYINWQLSVLAAPLLADAYAQGFCQGHADGLVDGAEAERGELAEWLRTEIGKRYPSGGYLVLCDALTKVGMP
jgi:hypothetical protein